MKSIRERIGSAQTALVLDHCFFGALALRLAVREAPEKSKTMATDGRSLFFNPEFVKTIDDDELVGLWAHEVMHPAMQHHTRRGNRDPEMWNKAADYEINPILVQAGFKLPAGALIDSRFDGMSVDQIYSVLDRERQQGGGRDDGGGENSDGTDGPKESAGDGKSDGNGGGNGEADGDGGKSDAPGEVLDAPDPSEDEAEWQVAVNQAANLAKMMGKLPAGMASVVEKATRPRIDWRAILRRFVQERAKSDYSWKMPNRRYIAQGIYLPEIRSEEMPAIATFVDTSGSTLSERGKFIAEMQSIAEECKPESTLVVHCDAAVAKVETFERGEPIEIKEWAGNGGTDFRPPFEYAEREQLQPACAIYLTDGYGRFPETAPDYPVLWVMTTDVVAPWGETVRIQQE